MRGHVVLLLEDEPLVSMDIETPRYLVRALKFIAPCLARRPVTGCCFIDLMSLSLTYFCATADPLKSSHDCLKQISHSSCIRAILAACTSTARSIGGRWLGKSSIANELLQAVNNAVAATAQAFDSDTRCLHSARAALRARVKLRSARFRKHRDRYDLPAPHVCLFRFELGCGST